MLRMQRHGVTVNCSPAVALGVLFAAACGSRTGLLPAPGDAGPTQLESDAGSDASGGSSGGSSGGAMPDGSVTPTCVPMSGVVTLAAGQSGLGPLAVDSTNVYWAVTTTSTGSVVQSSGYAIVRADKCGGEVSTLATGAGTLSWLGTEGGSVYAQTLTAPYPNGSESVIRVGIQGGAVSTLVTRTAAEYGVGGIQDVALDPTRIYWTEEDSPLDGPGNGVVMGAPLAGGAATTLASGQDAPFGVAAASGQVYWANIGGQFDYGHVGSAFREPVSGGIPVTLGNYAVGPVGLNTTSVFWSVLYESWSSSTQQYTYNAAVVATPLAGGTVTTVMSTGPVASAYPGPTGEVGSSGTLVVDDSSLYFVNQASPDAGTLMKVPVGGGVTTTLASAGAVGAIAIDDASLYWTSVADGSVVRLTPK
jgi:hypothetical protein